MDEAVFYVHDQILFFSGSDFFKDLLSGDWAENGKGKRRSVVTVASSEEVGGEGEVEGESAESFESVEEEEEGIICRVHLVEEDAGPFQDLLFHLYPHLTATLNWENGSFSRFLILITNRLTSSNNSRAANEDGGQVSYHLPPRRLYLLPPPRRRRSTDPRRQNRRRSLYSRIVPRSV